MPPKKNTIITIPALNDFIYTILYEAPLETKRNLEGRFLKAATNMRTAKRFIATSTREEKEHLLTHFNFSYYYVIHANKVTLNKFKESLKKFELEKRVVAIKDIADQGIFVTTDVQYCGLLSLMAKSMHDPSYYMNLELNRQGYHIRKWTKRLNNQQDFAMKELAENDNLLMRTILSSLMVINFADGFLGISPAAIKILLYFYTYKNTTITEEDIRDVFDGQLTGRQITYGMRCLKKEYCIEHGLLNSKELSITGIGIKKCSQFRDRVIKSNDF